MSVFSLRQIGEDLRDWSVGLLIELSSRTGRWGGISAITPVKLAVLKGNPACNCAGAFTDLGNWQMG